MSGTCGIGHNFSHYVHFHDHFNYSPPHSCTSVPSPFRRWWLLAGRPLPLANAMKCTHGWHCCYDSFCVGGRMQELLFRVRFNFPKSANWDGMILFSVHSSNAAVVVHFACYTLHDQRTSSVTDRQSDLLNQPTDELSCPIVSLCSGRRIEVLSRWNDNQFASTTEDYVLVYYYYSMHPPFRTRRKRTSSRPKLREGD